VDIALWIISALLPLLYLGAVAAYGMNFFAQRPAAARWSRPLLLVALAVHLADLVLLTLRWEQFPTATISQAMTALAFAIGLVYLFVEIYGRSQATGVWLLSVAFVFILLAALLRSTAPPHFETFESPLFAMHVGLALIGYAGFVVAACYGFLFLRVYRDLKAGRFSRFFGTLPPLEVLDRMILGAMFCGFMALSAASVFGAIWAEQFFPDGWQTDPKILLTAGSLVFYAIVLILRKSGRLESRDLAWASLAGFGILMFSLLAGNLLFSRLHEFH
jgi:ABC-type transport system involved in cytochrome c biogenesis permease subunit